jgi:hypothetical protein
MNLDKLKSEFPDYDVDTLPDIPEDWIDLSFRNDLCPSFESGSKNRIVFIQPEDPEEREFPSDPRFIVYELDNDETIGSFLTATDDWDKVLRMTGDVA